MTRPIIRSKFPFNKADEKILARLQSEEINELPIRTRIGPEGERQVRCASGEIYNIDNPRLRRKVHARRLAREFNPLPPAPAMAARAVA